jgi:hypothetical protein
LLAAHSALPLATLIAALLAATLLTTSFTLLALTSFVALLALILILIWHNLSFGLNNWFVVRLTQEYRQA